MGQNNWLSVGNSKLGTSVLTFSLPAGSSCPGKTELCSDRCYAKKGRFNGFKRKYDANLKRAESDSFVERISREIRRRKAVLVRPHPSGDFYSPEYLEKWARVFELCQGTRFWFYTRSWRLEEFVDSLKRVSKMRNVRVWLSCDQESGLPKFRLGKMRLAYLKCFEDEVVPTKCRVIFRDYPLRPDRVIRESGVLVCPTENGTSWGGTCVKCKWCHREEKPSSRVALPMAN